MKKEQPDWIFECRKCGHLLYIGKDKDNKWSKVLAEDCPNCGEEGDENWIFIGEGDFKKR
jgi:DNA-directed RNA polymerase subunit M/transcription elongation factor TFIIS